MTVVYLDQNKWIDLARAWFGKGSDSRLDRGLQAARTLVQQEKAVFPISGIHYMEMARIRNPDRRERLGTVMWELSRGYTMASYHALTCYELEVALSRRFPSVRPAPFTLIGRGIAHAFGMIEPEGNLPGLLHRFIDPSAATAIEAGLQDLVERSLLTGKGPGGESMTPFRVDTHKKNFMHHLATLPSDIAELPTDQQHDALRAVCLMDIVGPINEVLARHDLPKEQLQSLGKDGLAALLDDMPSRAVDLHLHRQLIKNPALQPRVNDLEDWAGLGPAVAHCDFVICERHFADLVHRDHFRSKARVLTDVGDLLTVLSDAG